MYRFHVGDLRTGLILRTVDLIEPRWASSIADGSVEGSFPLDSGEWPAARAEAAPAKSFLVVGFVRSDGSETLLEGGPIWASKFSDETSRLSITAADLSSYYDHRKVVPALAAGEKVAGVTMTYTGVELGLIAKRLVELAHTHTGGALPVVLPSDASLGGAGADHTRTFFGYELKSLGEALAQLTDVEGGPEMRFTPRFAADPRYVEWTLDIGTARTGMILTQDGPAWRFDRTAAGSPLSGIDVDTDGSQLAFRAWAAGEGEAAGRPIESVDAALLVNLGWPLLEGEVAATDTVSEASTLRGHAAQYVAAYGRPIETWSLKVNLDGTPNIGDFRRGDWALVVVRDHLYIPDGDYEMRILSVSGDASETCTLQMMQRLGEV